ncbi:MAG: hypothetical protein JWN80_2879 [Microbacteriaceae bacterium]|jgi:hypothetical protein|nr:hypothetical protein [Microbacteriaceae bacterium]
MTMAGYTATPQARKLGLKPGMRLCVDGAPNGWALDGPPPLERVSTGEPADVILLFLREAVGMAGRLRVHGELIRPAGALWVAWPRKAAGHVSDLGDAVIRNAALPLGLVDTKVAAIDENWSGLKLVWRLNQR